MKGEAKAMTMKTDSNQGLKPKLRFPEFQSGPEWENEAMVELYSFKGTNSFSRDQLNYESGTVKNIHYGDIHTKYPSLFDVRKETVPFVNPSESLEKISPDIYCVEGDIVFADASEDLEDVGKSIELVALNGERLLSGMHTILARQKRKALIVGFGGHLFKSARIRDQIKKEAQGAKVFGVSATRLSNIEIGYPLEKAEQKKIAECLTSLDELMAAHGQKLHALKAHKTGLMQQLFPREGETLPRLRFPEFQDAPDWISDSLGNILETSSGGTPERSVKEYWNGKIPWITTSLVDFNVIYKADEFISQ
jgi:type I restriction enzyme S subunit